MKPALPVIATWYRMDSCRPMVHGSDVVKVGPKMLTFANGDTRAIVSDLCRWFPNEREAIEDRRAKLRRELELATKKLEQFNKAFPEGE